jgi:hypothetical protein
MEHYKNKSLENLTYYDLEGNLKEEEWRDIKGQEEYYQVSNLGRVKTKRATRVYPLRNSSPYGATRKKEYYPQIKAQQIIGIGYVGTQLKGNGRILSATHRHVAIAFIEKPEGKDFVNHKNGIRHDNAAWNLEWMTRSENEQHSWRELGRVSVKGSRNGRSKLTEEDVVLIRRIYASGFKSLTLISKMFGVNHTTIRAVKKGSNWKHLL